jgi:predicted aldo/keto reductase-like oxidoreductase
VNSKPDGGRGGHLDVAGEWSWEGKAMLYRAMPRSGDLLSILGYGCMRLPEKAGRIDKAAATAQLRRAIDAGVNYVDTAAFYHMGGSEPFLGYALGEGYRAKVKLATKLPYWLVKTRSDMDRLLGIQLGKLNTSHVDYYLIHNLKEEGLRRMLDLGMADFVARARTDGRIVNIGFSAHVPTSEFKSIVDGFDWDFCQIQYNFLDTESQAGTEVLKHAASRRLGVIVMEPLRGGMLARKIPQVQAVWDSAEVKRSPAEWALRWLWDHPEVTVVLSGMSDMHQVDENVRIAGDASPGAFTREERGLVARAVEAYRGAMKVGCTGCGYCMPCPEGIDIPAHFQAYNYKYMAGGIGSWKVNYLALLGGGLEGKAWVPPSSCVSCGACAEACPQHIRIPEKLKEVEREFGGLDTKLFVVIGRLFLKFTNWKTSRPAG